LSIFLDYSKLQALNQKLIKMTSQNLAFKNPQNGAELILNTLVDLGVYTIFG